MGTESPSNEKTQEELFAEVSEALANGKDFSSLVAKAEIKDGSPEDDTETPEVEPAVVEETPPEPEVTEEEETKPNTTASTATDDWEAQLPDDVKEKIRLLREEKLQAEHRVRSELGRVPYLQRKVEELSRQLSEPRANPPKEAAATKTSVTQGKFAEKLAEARAVDPALADLLEAMRDEIVAPLREEFANEVNQTKALFVNKEQEQLWQTEKSKLLTLVPEADQVFAHPLYKQWKSEIPENLRNLASSIYADEVVVALGEFYRYAERVAPELIVKPETTTPPAAPAATVDKVTAERARRLNSPAPSTSATGPKGGDGIPENPEDLFKYVTEKIRKGESYKV